MIVNRRATAFALLALSVGVLDACHKKPKVAPAPVTVATTDTMGERRRLDSLEAARRMADENARRRAVDDSLRRANEATSASAALRAALTAVVYFEYDQDVLNGDAKAALDAKLPILIANPGLSIRITGHTDERGADEYNVALGQKRASAVKRYLAERGIAESRLETVSMGEERPANAGHDEASWSQNRRAEFEITAGANLVLKARQ
ncbi:MAG: peptidoglycan-associated lipoprotein [Gemmatimonadetes bacterium]|nr:peptidoglycan-associated lipoprotein [Gemmatimonadota bacterium]